MEVVVLQPQSTYGALWPPDASREFGETSVRLPFCHLNMRALLALVGLSTLGALAEPNPNPDHAVAGASTYWYANIPHTPINPRLPSNYTVFRNILDYGAKGDGKTDDTAAIQKAIDTGSSTGARGSEKYGSTGQPAVVFFPPGTYLVSNTIKNYIGTVWMGDPIDRPSIKASSSFKAGTLINGVDPKYTDLVGFYHEIKNLVFDTTAMATSSKITLVDWGLSQACQLSNSVFLMPKASAGHTAISSVGMNSPLLLNDLEIRGGGVGWTGGSTQYHFKNIYFKGVTTGIKPTNSVQYMVQGCRFEDVTTGVDMSGGTLGQLTMIDSSGANTQVLVKTDATQSTAVGSIVLENVNVDSTVPAVGLAHPVNPTVNTADSKLRLSKQVLPTF